jgi:hypothetical protein
MVCRLHEMSKFLKICSMPGHHFNIYQLFMMPKQPMRPIQPLLFKVVSDAELQALPQLIIRGGESGAPADITGWKKRRRADADRISGNEVLCRTQTEKRTSDGLFCMLRRKEFVPKEIRPETIRELEKIVATSSGCKISEYEFWTKNDGKQEVKLYLRSLKQIIEGILAEVEFRNLEDFWFEY